MIIVCSSDILICCYIVGLPVGISGEEKRKVNLVMLL